MKKIYVISKYSGNIEENVNKAIKYCQYVIRKGYMPLASHLLYPQMLDDNKPEERTLGCTYGLEMLSMCDEAWVFGSELSSGMRAELEEARRLEKKIRFITKTT